MKARNLHPTDDSPRARSEQHRARKISATRWNAEVTSALQARVRDLTEDERTTLTRGLSDPDSEIGQILAEAADNSKGRRWPAYAVAGRIFLTMISRRYAPPPARQYGTAESPDWSMW